ncbi:MAG: Ser-Thr-rich GPI-anchored membrane family protein [Cyclobacteriaceae bacterium]
MKAFLLLLATLLIARELIAQTVSIKKIELAGEKVIVHYDLDDSNPNNEYQLNLYASKDKFSAPLVKVKGDIGPDVKPGVGRKVEWNLLQEYGSFKGKLSLEIRGNVFVPFVKLKNFDTKKNYKRGKSYDVAWRPGNTNPIHIELYKGSQKVSGELNHPNSGAYSLSIGHKVKPGKDYRLKITDSRKTDEIIYSDYFQVSPKVPLLVKLIPMVAVAGGLAVLLGGSKGGGGGAADNSPKEIPLPALPGN